eukprot:3726535-Rhodomonas_salina.1
MGPGEEAGDLCGEAPAALLGSLQHALQHSPARSTHVSASRRSMLLLYASCRWTCDPDLRKKEGIAEARKKQVERKRPRAPRDVADDQHLVLVSDHWKTIVLGLRQHLVPPRARSVPGIA